MFRSFRSVGLVNLVPVSYTHLDAERIDWQLYKTPTQYIYEVRLPAFRQMTNHFLLSLIHIYIMKTMGFPGYFLIVQDFINAARKELGVSVGPGLSLIHIYIMDGMAICNMRLFSEYNFIFIIL